jgi:hypothetical protein
MSGNYTVAFVVRETRIIAMDLIDVEADSEALAIRSAKVTLKDSGQREMTNIDVITECDSTVIEASVVLVGSCDDDD